MKAIVLTAYGDVDQLQLREVPEPAVGPQEIKVRMAGASINPVDWKAAQRRLPGLHAAQAANHPGQGCFKGCFWRGRGGRLGGHRIQGRRARPGSRQWRLCPDRVAPGDAWAEVPATLNLANAGALPLVVLTGAQLVEEAVDVHAGDRVLITGATGSVGRASVFAAKAARVYAGVRGSQKAEAAKLGAEAVVALDDDGEVARLPQLDSIADTVGGETIEKLFDRLKPGGTIGTIVGDPPGAKERGFVVKGMMSHADPRRLTALAQAVARGELVIPIAKRFPLGEARQAQMAAENGAAGKVILTA